MYNYQKFLKEAQHATLIKTLQKMEREEEKHRSRTIVLEFRTRKATHIQP
jgi:hypothetical protein